MSRRRLYFLFSFLALVVLVATPASAGMSGPAVSGVQVQNLDIASGTTVDISLYPQGGGASVPLATGVSIGAKAATNFYLPNYSSVTSGTYAMVVSSTSAPVAAIARTDWSSTGAAAIYNSVPPATDVTIPLILWQFASQTSQFTIQNTDTSTDATDVSIALTARGQSTPLKTLTAQTIAKGTSKSWSLNDAVWGALPNTGVDMGATGFVGSIRITSSHQLEVMSFIDLAGAPAVTGFSGVPTASATDTLFCPLIRANYYGDTGISLVNTGGTSAAAVITFYPDAGSPHKGTTWTQNITVPANSAVIASQVPGGNSRTAGLPGGTQTVANPTPTNDGFYGVAKISAPAGSTLLAVVNDAKFGTGWAVKSQSTYNCATVADAGNTFALPLVRKYHLATTKLTTGIQIQNTGGTQVTVHLDLTNWDGTSQSSSDPADVVIPAYGSGNYFNGNLTGLPTVPPSAGGSGWYGSAILTATGGNVVVVVNDEGFGSVAVDTANYNGLKIQ
ncbi:MAG: hypothetical protein M1281_03510 [Chloroflexi bacterium]|nr:hypothetical protein [Chloroflexota bacterium]